MGNSVGSDFPLCLLLLCLLLLQTTPLPLHYLSEECGGQVQVFEGLLWHKHVALRAPGVGEYTFLQDHNCIPHVEVCKVNPEVSPT